MRTPILIVFVAILGLIACEDEPNYSRSTTDVGNDAASSEDTSVVPDTSSVAPDASAMVDTATEPVMDECARDEDCRLVEGCRCYAEPISAPPPMGNGDCAFISCENDLGVSDAICLDGRCVLDAATCVGATCNVPAPSCPDGFVASINPATGCWSNRCVLPSDCAEVNDCNQCASDDVCWENQVGGFPPRCYPVPAACDGTPDCSCIGPAAKAHCQGGCNSTGSPLLCLNGG